MDRFELEGISLFNAYQTDAILTMAAHGAIREFTTEPLSKELLSALFMAMRSAPSSANYQLTSVIYVTEQSLKERLAVRTRNAHVATAAAFFLFCADLHRPTQIAREKGIQTGLKGLELYTLGVIDVALMAQNAQVAAESLGLGTVHIGGVRNDPKGVAEILHLPTGVLPILGLVVGYPATSQHVKPRLPQEVTIHHNQYHELNLADIDRYDELMQEERQKRGDSGDSSWSETLSKWLSGQNANRKDLLHVYRSMGWPFGDL